MQNLKDERESPAFRSVILSFDTFMLLVYPPSFFEIQSDGMEKLLLIVVIVTGVAMMYSLIHLLVGIGVISDPENFYNRLYPKQALPFQKMVGYLIFAMIVVDRIYTLLF